MVDYRDHDENGIIRGFIEGEDISINPEPRIAITVDVLKVLNEFAIQNGYNRQLTEQLFEEADGRFPVYLKVVMSHMHKEGVPCELHMRTGWEIVLLDQSDAEEGQVRNAHVYVDIPKAVYDVLPNVPEALILAQEPENIDLSGVTDKMMKELSSFLSEEE